MLNHLLSGKPGTSYSPWKVSSKGWRESDNTRLELWRRRSRSSTMDILKMGKKGSHGFRIKVSILEAGAFQISGPFFFPTG